MKDCYLVLAVYLCGLTNSGAEVVTQSLADQVGAIDVYALTCSPLNGQATSYASLKILDSTNLNAVAPQKINTVLTKTGSQSVVKSLTEGSTEQYLIKGGNGKYTLTLDTVVKNVKYTTQNYQIYYQCFNSSDVATTASASGLKAGGYVSKSIAWNKKQSYTFSCALNKKVTPSDTSYLVVNLSNTSSVTDNSQSYLNAQLTKIDPPRTISTSDRFGDTAYGSEVKLQPIDISNRPAGDGVYYISVDTTANSDTTFKGKSYSLNYGCYSSNGQATTSSLSLIQDQ